MQFNFVKFVIIELQLIFRHKARLKNGLPRTPKTSNPIGTVLERSWNGLETVFGTVLERSLERSWNGLGTVFERSWNGIALYEQGWCVFENLSVFLHTAIFRWRFFTHRSSTLFPKFIISAQFQHSFSLFRTELTFF